MGIHRGLLLLGSMHKILGINMLEVIAALLIMTILAAAAVPSFLSFIQEHRLTLTAENFATALQYARSEAIKRNATIYVSFQTGDSWCYGINTGSSCTCSTPSGCNLGTNQAPQSQQTSLSLSGISSNTIQFDGSRGAANVSNGKITLTVYGASTDISILVSVLGNISFCSSTIGGYSTCPY